jgi:predicted SAM-dependent methyltransferase
VYLQRRDLRALARRHSKRIAVGASGIDHEGWVSTDREVIDLLREETWSRYFSPDSLDGILAEHVWEHLSPEEALTAAGNCYRFLKPGGYLRVAVPDGGDPDPAYIAAVRPGGCGAGALGHKVLYNFATFRDVFAAVGFDVRLHEYFDAHGQFHDDGWSWADGPIRRSRLFGGGPAAAGLPDSSINLDAVKPH